MKIDLHCHTKKTKSGEKDTRNVTKEKFAEVISNFNISIVAITNHNYFSLQEFNEFQKERLNKSIQLWPGIELDVDVDGEKGHILVIGNPEEIFSFDSIINGFLKDDKPDDFIIDFKDLCLQINNLDVILIAHYLGQKDHGFSDKAISLIKEQLDNKNPILVEPSQLKTAGIMAANGYDVFIGSDVKDWNKYPIDKIPTLKLSVKDFKTFKLLLKKDKNTIDTFINQKKSTNIEIKPFSKEGDNTSINLPIFNDVNIIFGGKATGKSRIIESIKDYYEKAGKTANITYYKASDNVDNYNNLIKRNINEDMFKKLNVSDCSNNIKYIKEFSFTNITSTALFLKGMQSKRANSKAYRLGFSNSDYSYIENLTKYDKIINDLNEIDNAISSIKKVELKDYITENESNNLLFMLNELKTKVLSKAKNEWIENKSKLLTKWTIKTMKDLIKIKTGVQVMPSSTGLFEFFSKLQILKSNVDILIKNFKTNHISEYELIGNLPEKFNVYLCLEYWLNPEDKSNTENMKREFLGNKSRFKESKNALKAANELSKNTFSNECKTKLNDFNSKFSNINSLQECFYFNSYVVKKVGSCYDRYEPSNGEKSMLQIINVFQDQSKEIFILDEPELSVGHSYINKNIVPKIIELSKLDKTIIISTHDANIAVRTLPINSIYREYGKTFIGNLFLDKLTCKETNEEYSWTEKSLDYLEGGKEAFSERGGSYGV